MTNAHRIRSILATAGATTVVAGVLAVGGAAPASASAQGCTPAPNGTTCNSTNGTGLHVDNIEAIRDKANTDFICNYSARVHIDDPSGTEVFTAETGIVGGGNCAVGRAYITFPVNQSFPDGSHTYVEFFESGVRQGGVVELEIQG